MNIEDKNNSEILEKIAELEVKFVLFLCLGLILHFVAIGVLIVYFKYGF